MKDQTLIIAEIGENHLGNMDMASQMVKEASTSGADIVKFQSYYGKDLDPTDPEFAWFSEVELSNEAHWDLLQVAKAHDIQFTSSPFTVERATFLCETLGLDMIKIASSELLNFPLLDYVNNHVDTVFLSTGMSTLSEIQTALEHLTTVKNTYILHCTTQYPCQDSDSNLSAITTLKNSFPNCLVGYSDHTIGITASIAAASIGASVIEKHFTLDKSLPGTDHILSATPSELAEMIDAIRRVESMMGSPIKQPVSAEKDILDFVRNRWRKS